MMNGGLQLNQDTSGEESDEPGDSAGLALIEQILLSGDLRIPKNLIPQEIEEEVDDAIDDIVDDEDDTDSIENAFDDEDSDLDNNASEISAYHSANIASYWQASDGESELNPYYDHEESPEYSTSTEAYIGEETKQFNTAVKDNYNARLKNELGMDFQDEELSETEKARSYTFKVMNPSMWKWMYEASASLVLTNITTG